MKTPANPLSKHSRHRMLKSLASTVVIFSLAACGSDSGGDVLTDLENGEQVSTNDDGDLVNGVADDDSDAADVEAAPEDAPEQADDVIVVIDDSAAQAEAEAATPAEADAAAQAEAEAAAQAEAEAAAQAEAEAAAEAGAAFATIQDTVFTPICAECHGEGSVSAGLSLNAGSAFANLVGVASTQNPSLSRIAPNDPDNSYLVQKIEGIAAFGSRMPLGGAPLPQETIDFIRQWVSNGAPPSTQSALLFAPRVAFASLDQDETLDSMPDSVTIVWTSAIEGSSFTDATVSLVGSGGDGVFNDGNDVVVDMSVAVQDNPYVTKLVMNEAITADDVFQLRIAGDGDTYASAADAGAIDGDGDGEAGGNYVLDFSIENQAADNN